MKEESLLLLSDLQKLINQVVLIDYTIIILGDEVLINMRIGYVLLILSILLVCLWSTYVSVQSKEYYRRAFRMLMWAGELCMSTICMEFPWKREYCRIIRG